MNGSKKTYLSAQTADGLKSFFESVYEPFCGRRYFLVTGASGKIRSDFISSVAETVGKEGFHRETVLSAFDSEKIDGVIFDEIDVCICDISAMGNIDFSVCDCAQYIVDLGETCDRTALYEKREEIFSVRDDVESHLCKCRKFLGAALSMSDDTRRIVGKSLNAEKLEKFVARFVRKEFGTVSQNSGKLSKRLISALSPEGIATQYDTIKSACARIYVLDDEFDIVSDALINQIKDAAVLCGYDVILCPDCIDPEKSRHVIIPQLSLCFFTSDSLCKWDDEYTKKVNYTRFVDRETVKCHKNRIRFNNDAIEELICQASVNLEIVKCDFDRLDDIYDGYCEKEKINEYVENTTDQILRPLKAKEDL